MSRLLGRAALVAVAVVAAAVLVAACGVPTQTEATTTDPEDVPFDLADEHAAAPPSTALPVPGPSAQVYLVDESGERLTGVVREIDDDEVDAVLDALLSGPTVPEAEQGIATALPDDDVVQSVEVAGGVAAVDVAAEFTDLDPDVQRIALAQIVFTLTGRPGIGRVAFTLEGQPVEVPRGDGTVTIGSVSRDSYVELGPAS